MPQHRKEVSWVNFPNLFQKTIWPWGPTRAIFNRCDFPPPDRLISNVNIVPYVGVQWLMLRLQSGEWEIPGGTLEPGENYLDAVRRELLEEAGARLVTFEPFGAWHCHSLASKPYRPHLPHPEFYRLVGYGEVKPVSAPQNPAQKPTPASTHPNLQLTTVATGLFRQTLRNSPHTLGLERLPHGRGEADD